MRKHLLILCLLGNPYQKADGGFNKTVYEIIEYFKEKDILITVITSNIYLSQDKFQQKYPNINFWELSLNPEWVENQDQLFINVDYLVDKIKRIINKYKDIISFIHSLQWINGYLATKINLQQEMIHIHSIISSSFERKATGFSLRSQYQRQCEDVTFNSADLLISITESEKRQLIDYYKVSPLKILVIGRPADLYYKYFHDIYHSQISKIDKLEYNSILTKESELHNQKAFVYVGRIIEYKGILEIIKAWHLLYMQYKDEMPPLWIIGGSNKTIYQFRDTLIEKISFLIDCERCHKIYWWGYMENYGISTIFQRSHVLLMHSAFEPGGRVVLEAMSAGRPIIATPTGFAQSYIKDWYNGFQVEYQNIASLAKYMNFFIKNEFLSSMMGINAQNTYKKLSNEWSYYEKLEKLYRSNEVINEIFPSQELKLEPLYPYLIDEFPYCDVKNDETDLFFLLNSTNGTIEEMMKNKSYIWKISIKNDIYIAKQVYNRINLKQIWNTFDIQKVHTIWMQYYTASLSTKYSCITKPSLISEKLYTYLLPYYEILGKEQVYQIYPSLLSQLGDCEHGSYDDITLLSEQIQYFEKRNHSLQYKHKYYTMNIYLYELKTIFDENKIMFETYEISLLLYCFQEINKYLSSRSCIKYGLNYGKSFFKHIVHHNTGYLLLPSSDIFIGELGQDEGIIFAEYYLNHHIFLENTYYPRKVVLLWSLLYCMELLIESKILWKSATTIFYDLKEIFNEINNEK